MLRLLLLLFLFPISLISQYPASPDMLCNGKTGETGGKRYLFDTVSNSLTTDFEILNADWDTSLNYIPETHALLVYFQTDTVPFRLLMSDEVRNLNDADTTYTQVQERVINADTITTERAILRIVYYDTPAPDVNNFFNAAPLSPTGHTVGVDKDFADLFTAISSGTVGGNDTIYLFDSEEGYANLSGKDLSIIAVGNAKWRRADKLGDIASTENYVIFKGVYFQNSDDVGIRITSSTVDSVVFENCWMQSDTENNIISASSASTGLIKVINTSFKSKISTSADVNLYGTNFEGKDGMFLESGINTDTVSINYCRFGDPFFGGGFQFAANDLYFYSNSNKYTDEVIYDNGISSVDLHFKFNNDEFILTENDNSIFEITTLDSSTFSFYNCDFKVTQNTKGTVNTFENQNDISFVKCRFDSTYGSAITVDHATNMYKLIIDSCVFISDSVQSVISTDYLTVIKNSYFDSKDESSITDFSVDLTGMQDTIKGNTIITQGLYGDDAIGAFIRVGDENNTSGFGGKDGSIISDNLFLGPGKFNNDFHAMHGVFTSGQNMIVQRNYVEGAMIGFLTKHRGLTYKVIHRLNVAKNNRINYYAKGAPTTEYRNNTGYTNLTIGNIEPVVFIADELVPGSYSDSCIFKNNLIHNELTNITCISFQNAQDTVGVQIDSNVVFNAATTDNYSIVTTRFTLQEWQGIGDYSAYSSSGNPNLKSETEIYPVKPSSAQGRSSNYSPLRIGINAEFPYPSLSVDETTAGAYTIANAPFTPIIRDFGQPLLNDFGQ